MKIQEDLPRLYSKRGCPSKTRSITTHPPVRIPHQIFGDTIQSSIFIFKRSSSDISCSMPTKVWMSSVSRVFAISRISPLLEDPLAELDSYFIPRVCETTRESAPAPAQTPMYLRRLGDFLGDLSQRGLGVAFLVVDRADVLCYNRILAQSHREAALRFKMHCSPCT